MAPKQKISKTREKIIALAEENELASLLEGRNRARSITCGPSSGGMVEITMRSDTRSLWYNISPVEAVEFMTQLAASVGVEVAFRPRQDFAAWRAWDSSMPINSNWIGTAPWQLDYQEAGQKLITAAAAEKAAESVKEALEQASKIEDSKPKRTRKTNSPVEEAVVSEKPQRKTSKKQ